MTYRLYDAEDMLCNGMCEADGSFVMDFWRWAFGNLNDDTLKGLFAEWLVARLLNVPVPLGGRRGGANSDLILVDGLRIEVKSAAYWQSWKLYDERSRPFATSEIEEKHWNRLKEPLKFTVRRTRNSADLTPSEPKLWSHLYIFAAQYEKDPVQWNALDLSQWRFYCLTREQVENLPKTISEQRLRLVHAPVPAGALRAKVDEATSDVPRGKKTGHYQSSEDLSLSSAAEHGGE